MKLSDFVISFVESKGIRDVFLLAGGGIMHLLDSLAQNQSINKYYNLHEQASGFCADGYALYTGKPGVCFVTTGPGGTNTITALASSYIDSTPVVYFSGQVRTGTITTIPGVRQTGAQEADIISMVTPVTKYAVTVMNADDIRYHLEKAFFIATHERPGPVWIEIPLDIQAHQIDEKNLRSFDPVAEGFADPAKPNVADIQKVYELLAQSKRPVILAGSGIYLSGGAASFAQLISELGIPVVSSRRVRDILKNENEHYYFGCVGALANRYANYIVQNSDFLLSIGSGLRYYITAYNEENFAPRAKRIIVNVSAPELEKLHMSGSYKIVSDAKEFIDAMLLYPGKAQPERSDWLKYCNRLKLKYPTELEYKPNDINAVNPYKIMDMIGDNMRDDDIWVTSPSGACYPCCFPTVRGNQRTINHIGLGSMGTALPEAIGACIAGSVRTIVCEGDGSLQHNIQELALLKQYNLPIKIFVDNNSGYRQIATMQNTHFHGRHAGCDIESGIRFPNFELLAAAYGINYLLIDCAEVMEERVLQALIDDAPVIVEMITTMDVEYLPVVKSKMNADGTMMTPSLEILYPFLSEEEHLENMKVPGE